MSESEGKMNVNQQLVKVAVVLTALVGLVAVDVVAPEGAEAVTKRQRIVNEAMKHRGKKYRYGANGPRNFDCSGYTRYVYRTSTGRKLPRTAQQQYNRTVKIGGWNQRHRAKVGDLVFWRYHGRVTHVAIWMGRGRVMHTGGRPVRMQKVWHTKNIRFNRALRRG